MTYQVSLTQFSNYLTKTSRQKATEARNIALALAEDYQHQTDYWIHLRNGVRHAMSTTGKADDLDTILDNVLQERQQNYQTMISGLKKFWGKKTIHAIKQPKRIWKYSKIRIGINLEICGEYRNKVYLIKFYAHVNQTIRKDEADMMLLLMQEALQTDIESYSEQGKDVILGVLDVGRGKLHQYRSLPEGLSALVKIEAEGLYKFLSNMIM